MKKKVFCLDCLKYTKHIQKLSAVLSGNLVCDVCRRMNNPYQLTKPEDESFYKGSMDVKWIEYDEQGRYKGDFNEPGIGRSLLMSPFNDSFTWLTTIITEVIEETNEYILFKTQKTLYKLTKPI
jgi:hypothetical protein